MTVYLFCNSSDPGPDGIRIPIYTCTGHGASKKGMHEVHTRLGSFALQRFINGNVFKLSLRFQPFEVALIDGTQFFYRDQRFATIGANKFHFAVDDSAEPGFDFEVARQV